MKTVVTTLDLRQPADCIPRCPRPAGPLRRSSGLQAQRRLMHIKGAAVTQQHPPDKPEYSAHDSQRQGLRSGSRQCSRDTGPAWRCFADGW